jgi:hypothetical protein
MVNSLRSLLALAMALEEKARMEGRWAQEKPPLMQGPIQQALLDLISLALSRRPFFPNTGKHKWMVGCSSRGSRLLLARACRCSPV